MILQQHFLVPRSNILSVASNHNDCQHERLLFRPVLWNVNLKCSAKLKCGRLTYWHTSLMRHLSQQAAQRTKSSSASPGGQGHINLGKEECNLRNRYDNALRTKGVQDARNMKETVAGNRNDETGFWQSFLSEFSGGARADTIGSGVPDKYNLDDKINSKETGRSHQSKTNVPQFPKGTKSWIQFLGLLDPSPENLLVLLLPVLLVLATGQTLWQLFLVSASIVVTAVQYAAIAAMLLGILVALL